MPVTEKRRQKRVRRRLPVKYGEHDFSHAGFTVDVSRTGAFVLSPHRPGLDTRIHLQIFLHPDQCVYFEAAVRRHKIVPPELRTLSKGGFGVQFLQPSEILKEIIVDSQNSIDVFYSSEEELKLAYEKELQHGGVFIDTHRRFPPDAEVMVVMHFDFVEKSLEFPASAVHVGRDPSRLNPRGVALLFKDPKSFQHAVRTFLQQA